jgi:hypothetical protein
MSGWLQKKMQRELQFLVSQIVTGKIFQRMWRRNSHKPHLWRAEEAWLIHEIFQFKFSGHFIQTVESVTEAERHNNHKITKGHEIF